MKKNLRKKLSLNRQTIADVSGERMQALYGGAITATPLRTCADTCNTDAENCSNVAGICGRLSLDFPCNTMLGGCLNTRHLECDTKTIAGLCSDGDWCTFQGC